MVRPETTAPAANKSRIAIVKVIASSLRKGNIVDIDGKLYVVLTAENFHPGKGTPTTQVDMRRISDGVKTSQRYKTTDQVERAHVEDHDFSYLYQDGDGFHFMNQETYDQIHVSGDIVGDYAAYLQEGMVVNLSVHEGVPVAIEIPQKVTLEIVDTEPVVKGQTASGSFKPAKLGERRADHGADTYHRRHPGGRQHRRRLLRGTRQGLDYWTRPGRSPVLPSETNRQGSVFLRSRPVRGRSGKMRPAFFGLPQARTEMDRRRNSCLARLAIDADHGTGRRDAVRS